MFNKPATSIENQIKLLKGRGLIIAPHEEDEIRLWLTNVTYYKLSGYWFIFEVFPARAGVIPLSATADVAKLGIPRTSGGDPSCIAPAI